MHLVTVCIDLVTVCILPCHLGLLIKGSLQRDAAVDSAVLVALVPRHLTHHSHVTAPYIM